MEDEVSENRDLPSVGGEAPPGGAFVRRFTAPGRGAIAVIRVWGPTAIDVVDAVFRPHRGVRLAETPRGALRLGKIGQGQGDEVVVVALEGQPPAVEVQCHGGGAAVALVFEALEQAGAQRSDRPLPASHISGDPFADLALADLARAPTLLTAEILLDQAHGALRRELVRLSRSIDHQPDRALAGLETLIGRARVGLRLSDGWRVVIAGRPNVGKSRLFNALAGFARAIVDPTPGTTRDVVSLKASFGGWPVEMADTAGLREASGPIESIGIERARQQQRQADLMLLVLERSLPLQPIDVELIATCPGAILVANKSDLPPAWDDGDGSIHRRPIVTVSAERGDGLTRLIDAITRRLVPEAPPKGEAVPFRPEQLDQLRQIRASLLCGDRSAAALRLGLMIHGPDWPDQKS